MPASSSMVAITVTEESVSSINEIAVDLQGIVKSEDL